MLLARRGKGPQEKRPALWSRLPDKGYVLMGGKKEKAELT